MAFIQGFQMRLLLRLGRSTIGLLPWLFAVGGTMAQTASDAPCRIPRGGSESATYFPAREPTRRAAIVLVHGVLGDAVSTWLNVPRAFGPDVFWPCLIRADPAFSGSNIYLHGFFSDKLSASPTLDQAASKLFNELDSAGVFRDHSHLMLVGHSMGGLIIARMLMQMQDTGRNDQLGRVRVVMFYGSPGRGSAVAGPAAALSSNIQFAELSDIAALDGWLRRWRPAPPDLFHSFCAVETNRVSWLPWRDPIVSQDSASALCGGANDRMYGLDHFGIVKPRSVGDEPHRVLYNRYMRCVAPRLRNRNGGDTATEAGRSAADWFERIQNTFVAALSSGADTVGPVRAVLHSPAGLLRANRYVAPKGPRPGLAPSDIDMLDANAFSVEFSNQMATRMPQMIVENTVRLERLEELVADSGALDLRDNLLQGGQLANDDLVVVVRNRAQPDGNERILLFVARTSIDRTRIDGRLKGFVLTKEASRCE